MVLGFASHYYNFLPALLAQLIPNTTAPHPITYTNNYDWILENGSKSHICIWLYHCHNVKFRTEILKIACSSSILELHMNKCKYH